MASSGKDDPLGFILIGLGLLIALLGAVSVVWGMRAEKRQGDPYMNPSHDHAIFQTGPDQYRLSWTVDSAEGPIEKTWEGVDLEKAKRFSRKFGIEVWR